MLKAFWYQFQIAAGVGQFGKQKTSVSTMVNGGIRLLNIQNHDENDAVKSATGAANVVAPVAALHCPGSSECLACTMRCASFMLNSLWNTIPSIS
jgi:hypothetical protein